MAAVTDSEKERELNARLFHALMENDKDVVIELCRQESTSDGPLHVTSIHKDTVLHLACYSKQPHLAEELVQLLPNNPNLRLTKLKNDVGNTVLHEAATSNSLTQVATVMIAKQRKLLTKRNILGETPLFRAVRFGKIKMFKLLAHEVDKDNQEVRKEQLQSKDGTSILHIAVITEHFGEFLCSFFPRPSCPPSLFHSINLFLYMYICAIISGSISILEPLQFFKKMGNRLGNDDHREISRFNRSKRW